MLVISICLVSELCLLWWWWRWCFSSAYSEWSSNHVYILSTATALTNTTAAAAVAMINYHWAVYTNQTYSHTKLIYVYYVGVHVSVWIPFALYALVLLPTLFSSRYQFVISSSQHHSLAIVSSFIKFSPYWIPNYHVPLRWFIHPCFILGLFS